MAFFVYCWETSHWLVSPQNPVKSISVRTGTEFDWQIEIDSIKVLWREVTLPGREEDRGVKLMRGRVGKSGTGTNDSQVLSACMSPWIHIPGRSSYQHVQVPCAPLGCWCTCIHKVNTFWDREWLVFWVRKGCSEPRVALQTVAVHFWIYMSFFFFFLDLLLCSIICFGNLKS